MIFVVTLALTTFASVWGGELRMEQTPQSNPLPEWATELETSPVDMEAAISKVEALIKAADQSSQFIIPLDESEANHMNTIEVLDDIIEAVIDPKNADVFLKANGLTRIVAPNINTENSEIKTKLIILLKVLFSIAPRTTIAYIPHNILESLLDIFENDDVSLKAHSLDILAQWLPGNPSVQVKVMRLKGLEPFYNQIKKLDVSVIKVMLDLFNTLLEEHLAARDENKVAKMEPEIYHMYRRIGLIERLSTAHVCIGFLNIFRTLWTYNIDDNRDVIVTLYRLMKNLKPCMILYKGKTNAVRLFESLLNYIQDETRKDYFEKLKLNVTDFADILTSSIHKIKFVKDEL